MQGELSEIDVRSILQLVELGQRTGQLWVQASPSQGQAPLSWFVFFVNGQIVYAGNPGVGIARLQGMVQRYRLKIDWAALAIAEETRTNTPEYACLWNLIEQRRVEPYQARDMLETMVREALFELLSLRQGTFIFEMAAPLTPQLMSLPITPLVGEVAKQVQEWKQFYPQLQSPDQAPVIVDAAALQQALPASTVSALMHYADRQMSLRQLAYALNRDIVAVARAIYPCVQRGWVTFTLHDRPPTSPFTLAEHAPDHALHIACIDDAVTIGELVRSILTAQGYQVTVMSDPIQALTQVFQAAPQIILCDIDMPHLNGYEFCAMLRQSSQFHQVPILMLTGKDGFIDRVRATMVGATDYLAKPFGAEELIMLIEKHASQSVLT